jgi:hypothetical protein
VEEGGDDEKGGSDGCGGDSGHVIKALFFWRYERDVGNFVDL